jgi:ATP-dependent Clp protease ATP-binding subunit ClpC
VFDRFDDDTRKSLGLARQEAQRLRHDYIGTEHVLLGLAADGGGVAGRVFDRLGIDKAKVRRAVDAKVQPGPTPVTAGQLPFTAGAKRVLELTLEEAVALEHTRIGTGHLLLGLLRQGDGVGAQALRELGVDLEYVRGQVRRGLYGKGGD